MRETGAGRLLVSAVILPILLICGGAGWLAWQSARVSRANDWVRRSEHVVDEANLLQEQLVNQETGLRGFLITREPSFLGPYEASHPHETLDALEQHVADDPRQVAIVRALREEFLAWEDSAVRAIAAPEAGRQLAEMAPRKAQMDRMRGLIDDFMRLQEAKRIANYTRVARENRISEWSAVTLFVLLGGGAALASLRQIRALAASIARERAAVRAKDDFIAMFSHELRTPLTAILGWTQLVRQKHLGGEALDRALATIERNAQTEAQLVDDVLDTARITGGKLKLAADVVDPAAVAIAAADVVRLAAETRGVALEMDVAPGIPAVIGDAARLQQVVWNLLTNAVKFTPKGGHVRLSAALAGPRVRIHVADDGEGIPKEKLPHVFDRFWQADTSLTRRHGGLGLGLSIVKEIVSLHGGDVQAESEGPGRGSAFTVTLPVAAVCSADQVGKNGLEA